MFFVLYHLLVIVPQCKFLKEATMYDLTINL